MQKIRAYWRLVIFIWITLSRVTIIVVLEAVLKKNRARRDHHKMAWARDAMKSLGVKVEVKGIFPDQGVLIASRAQAIL